MSVTFNPIGARVTLWSIYAQEHLVTLAPKVMSSLLRNTHLAVDGS